MNADRDRAATGTFADVFNGLTMGRSRGPRPVPGRHTPVPALAAPIADPGQDGEEVAAASVRAYAWTGGRVRVSRRLEIETLVSTTAGAEDLLTTMRSEHHAVAVLCRHSRSVAEIAALLSLPLGVVRVLLDDMATLGLVDVHTTTPATGGEPDLALLSRVLRGLTNLRT